MKDDKSNRRAKKAGKKKLTHEFIQAVEGLMMVGVILHKHEFDCLPYPCRSEKELLDSFVKLGRKIAPKKGPVDAAEQYAKLLMGRVIDGRTRGAAIPFELAKQWLKFLPGDNIQNLPVTGEIPVIEAKTGEAKRFYIEIDGDGKGAISIYHDPESDSVRIGREVMLKIISTEEFMNS